MRTISLSVSSQDYEAFRRAARAQGRPIAQLIREAMASYRAEKLVERQRLAEVPVLPGHRRVGPFSARHEVYEEIFDRRRHTRR